MKKSKLLPLLILLMGLMSSSTYAQSSKVKRDFKFTEYKAFAEKQKAQSEANKKKSATRKIGANSKISAERKAAIHSKIKPKMTARMTALRAEKAKKAKVAKAKFLNKKPNNQ